MGAFDDLPDVAATPVPGGLFDDLPVRPPPTPKRKVGVVEAGARGVGSTFAEQGNVLALAASAPAMLLDAAAGLFTGTPVTRAQDFMFRNVVDPAKRAVDYYKPDAATEEMGTGATVANVGGRLAGMIPSMIAGGGAAGPSLAATAPLLRAAVSARAPLQALQIAAPEAARGAVAALPSFAIPATTTRAQDLLEAGVDRDTVLKASIANLVSNTAQGALPLAVPGRLLTRVPSGIGINVGAGAAGRAIEGQVLGPEYEKEQQAPFSLESSLTEGGIGGLMAAFLGGRAPRAARLPPPPPPRPDPTLAPLEPREPPPTTTEHIDAGPLGTDPNAAVREVVTRLFEGADTSRAPNLKLVEPAPPSPRRGRPVLPTNLSDMLPPRAPDLETTGEPRRPARGPDDLVADLAAQGETPESVARSFDMAYGQRGPAVEAATQASNLPPLDADSLRVIQEHMGVEPEQTLALGPNSQRRLLKAAMDAQAENAARGAQGPLAATNIKAQDEGAGPASPASKPNVPGERDAPEARTFDQQEKAAESPPDPQAVKRKAAMTQQLDTARKQLDALRQGQVYNDLKRRSDAGERLSESEAKFLTQREAQLDRLGKTIFDLEGKIYETEAKSEAGSRAASGTSDRPFRTEDAGPDEGPPTMEQAQQRQFRDTAEQKARDAQKEALDRLEAEWRARQETRRERAEDEEARRRRGEGDPGERYRDAPRSPNAAKEQDGNFRVDPEGFVMSDQGAPVWFAHQRDAGWWILRTGNKQAPGKVYQIANHPSGQGFTVQVTGDSSPGGGGRRGGGGGEPGGGPRPEGPAPAGNERTLRIEAAPRAEAPRDPFATPDPEVVAAMRRDIDRLRREGKNEEADDVADHYHILKEQLDAAQEPPRAAVNEGRDTADPTVAEDFPSFQSRMALKHGAKLQMYFEESPNGSIEWGFKHHADATKKKGAARAFLDDLTSWLDREQRGSYILAATDDPRAFPQADLVAMYRRRGWEPLSEQRYPAGEAVQMWREPRGRDGQVSGKAAGDGPRDAGRRDASGGEDARRGQVPAEPESGRAAERPVEPQRAAEEVAPEAEHEKNIRSWVKSFRLGIGRDDVGGRLIVDEVNRHREPGFGTVLGQTPHTGDPMWFGRPDQGLSAPAARNAIDKYLAGKKLGVREQRYIDYLREHAEIAEREIAQALREEPEVRRADVDEALEATQQLDASYIDARMDDLDNGRLSEAEYERELQRGASEKAQEAEGDGNRPAAEAEPVGPRDEAGRAAGRDDFELEQPTPEQLREREQRRVDAERAERDAERGGQRAERARQRELDAAELRKREERVRKERADAAVDDFALGQEPPRKTVARDEAAGQRGLLDEEGGPAQGEPEPGPGTTGGGKLYSGLPLDEMFKWLGRGIERITGPLSEWKDTALAAKEMAKAVADAFVEQGKHVFGKTPGESPIGRIARTILYNVHSHIVAFGRHWKSPTVQKIADMIYPTAGKEQSGQSFHEASETHVAQRQKELEGIRVELDRLAKVGVTDAQIISMVENPRSRQGKAGELATRIAKWFKEEQAYQREAGVDIGTVDNYFPREYDRSKIIPDRVNFIEAATRAYEKMDLPHDEAKRAAEAFWHRRTYGADGTPGGDYGGAGNPLFTRSREFTPEAAKELKHWRTESVSDTLEAYLMRSTRMSEIHRRFGYTPKELQAMRDAGRSTVGKEGAWGKWGEMESQIKKEAPGVREADIHELRAMAASAMGFRPPTLSSAIHQGAQYLRMVTTMALLPKAAFSSISESVAPIFRSNGDVAVAATQLRNVLYENVRSLAKQAYGEGRTEHMKRLFEFAQDIGVLVESSVASPMRDRWLGDDVTNKRVAGMTAKFFKLNMLDQLTNWQRAIGIDASRVFLRRMSQRADAGGKSGDFFLKELGIPEAKMKEFTAFVRKLGDDLPDASMLGGEMGQLYRNAMVRFSDQSIQRPNAATRPRWANTELGSVVFQLQGFANSYHKNVLLRQKNLMVEAWKGDYTSAERAQLMGGMIPGMILSAAVAGLVWELRDRLYNKDLPNRTTWAKIERAVSGSGMLGALDPYIQMIGGLRYNRPISSAVGGPAVGAIQQGLEALAHLAIDNNEKTNTAERRAADLFYQWGIEPAATVLMAASPAPARPLTQALTTLALPAARQYFVDKFGGERAKKPKQIRGLTEGKAPPKSEMTFQQRLQAERDAAQQ